MSAEHHMASATSIVHTVEAMQMATEEFGEHVEHCNVSFKQSIMEKVKELKKTDTTILTERVSFRYFKSHFIMHRWKNLKDRRDPS